MYLVYKHTTPSGKVYIGITRQTAEERWDNGRGYKGCTRFYGAIMKYGWENIEHEILHDGLTKEEACELERHYIEAYRATDGRYGYNLKSGGEAGSIYNEEVRKRMSESQKKFWELHPEKVAERSERMKNLYELRPEMREKVSEGQKKYYKLHPERRKEMAERFTGRQCSEEAKQKMSAAHKGKRATDEAKKKMSEAQKRRLEDEALYQARIQQLVEVWKKRSRSVEQLDAANGHVLAVYESAAAAARATGISQGNISKVVKRGGTAGGYKWRYVLDDTDKEA